jgi:hypothetical protein
MLVKRNMEEDKRRTALMITHIAVKVGMIRRTKGKREEKLAVKN